MQTSDFSTHPPLPEENPSLGEIKINHSVVASIVRLATLQVKGVAGVGGGLADGIAELFSKREADHRGVKVEEDAHDSYTIEIRLIVAYGAEIAKTAYEVQLAVRKQVMAMTGKGVARVDAIVEGVRLPADAVSAENKGEELWPDIHATD